MNVEHARRELAAAGVALLPGAVTPQSLISLRTAVLANRATGRPMSRQVLYTHGPVPTDRPPLTSIMDQWLNPHRVVGPGSTQGAAEALRPLATQLLGEPAVLFQDLLLIKRAGQGAFPWHQDFAFWPVEQPLGVVIWVPLVPSDGDTGALRFAVGSHRLGPRPAVDLHNGASQDTSSDLGFAPADWPELAPAYAEGDAVAFTPLTFHMSPAMLHDRERAAWSCIFLSPRVRWSHDNAPNHPLCRVTQHGALVTEAGHV